MTAWTADELARIDRTEEIGIASRRPDGSLRPFVTIWIVRLGDDVFVRSAYGRDNRWFQNALASRDGRIQAAGLERDVAFEEPGSEFDKALHDVYRRKYERHGPRTVGTVVSGAAARSTLRLVPRENGSDRRDD